MQLQFLELEEFFSEIPNYATRDIGILQGIIEGKNQRLSFLPRKSTLNDQVRHIQRILEAPKYLHRGIEVNLPSQ